jgi:flagellar protein FlaI
MVTRPSFQVGVQEVTPFDLLKSTLRQRPDYIIVGEIRGEEAYTLFQSISIGHGGMCTIHADSVDSVIKRLLTKPMDIPRLLIPVMNVVALVGKVKTGGTIMRKVKIVSEIVAGEEETGKLILNTVYEYDGVKTVETISDSNMLRKIAESKNVPFASLIEEIIKRSEILNWLVKKNVRAFDDVSEVVRRYYSDPDQIYKKARLGID